jgi:hypothetical protein
VLISPQDLADLLDPRRDVALETPPGRLVIPPAAQLVRQVLLGRDTDVEVVRVDIALAVPEPLGTGVVRVAQVHRHPADPAGAHVRDGLVDREVGRVRLRGRREVGGRLGKGMRPPACR